MATVNQSPAINVARMLKHSHVMDVIDHSV
jgi:hypothetical protein